MLPSVNAIDPGGNSPRIGDVACDETGSMYVRTMSGDGQPTWTCLDGIDETLQAILITILKTLRWARGGDGDADCKRPPTTRQRRASVYNSHIAAVLRKLALTSPSMPRSDRMRLAVRSWIDITRRARNDAEKRAASDDYLLHLSDIPDGGSRKDP